MNAFLAAFPEFRATVDIYAPAMSSGGTAGSATQVGTAVQMLIVPSANNEASGLLGYAPAGLAGGRSDFLGIHAGAVSLLPGYEVRWPSGSTSSTALVQGTANWTMGYICALSRVG